MGGKDLKSMTVTFEVKGVTQFISESTVGHIP
jgi:hypothetical protein